MTVTRDQQQMLVTLALACRSGGKKWDAGDLLDSIRKVAHCSLSSVALATLQAASDPKAGHPRSIAAYGVHWGIPAAPRPEAPAAPPMVSSGGSSFRRGAPTSSGPAPRVAAQVCPSGMPIAVDGSCCGRDHGGRL